MAGDGRRVNGRTQAEGRILHSPLSTIHSPLSTLHYPLFTLLLLAGGCAHPARCLVTSVAVDNDRQILAQDRDEFEKLQNGWLAELDKLRKTAGDGNHEQIAELENLLREANIDADTFFVRGPPNFEFPKMLYYNEFYKKPLYYAHPKNTLRQLTGRLPPASDADPQTGEVPNSSFFTNTCIPSYTPERITQEFNSFLPKGRMKITKIKSNRTSEGIWIKDEKGTSYIVLFDPPFSPEMLTSAEFIGSTLCRMTGYHVPKICICTVQGTGNPLYDGRRGVATIALKNFKGEWLYEPFRDRREIRALQLFGAWVNNVDQTEQNTGLTIDDNGVIRHYIFDFGASLGSFTFRPQIARMGWTRLFDAKAQFGQALFDHGLVKVPWEAPYQVHSAAVGYFNANFDPDRWQPFYTNMGFIETTEADRVWLARRISQFSDDQIRTLVALAGYSHKSDEDHVANTLIHRRDIIARRYLACPK